MPSFSLLSGTSICQFLTSSKSSIQTLNPDSNRLKKLLQLPYGYISLADVFGHLERNRWNTLYYSILISSLSSCWPATWILIYLFSVFQSRYQLGIAEYSLSQSTLESIFNHFAANSWGIITSIAHINFVHYMSREQYFSHQFYTRYWVYMERLQNQL